MLPTLTVPVEQAAFIQSAVGLTRSGSLQEMRSAQVNWSLVPVRERLRILKRMRHSIAGDPVRLARSIPCERAGSLHRNLADSLVAEVLPLLEACRFLEREAPRALAPERLSDEGQPFWLCHVTAEIHHEPLGVVLIIGPANYPLFIPGVQTIQALAAGNAVLWKPAPGCEAVAEAVRDLLVKAGLNPLLLTILDSTPAAAEAAIASGVDKVFLTGHEETGRAVMHLLAETLTPSVMELSGCDAAFVLPGADLDRVVDALAFGMRLNGSATCMAPRRLFVTSTVANSLIPKLAERFQQLEAVPIPWQTRALLTELLEEAKTGGASILPAAVPQSASTMQPTLVIGATAEMRLAQTDLFAPVVSVISTEDEEAALAAHRLCPYALTAGIFGPEGAAKAMASCIRAGTVLINDLIVSTADPRVPFGGRGRSGFGVTRGRAGLLEMTAIKTIVTQRSRSRRAYAATGAQHEGFFASYMGAAHGQSWRQRLESLHALVRAGSKLK